MREEVSRQAGRDGSGQTERPRREFPIVVHCHLRWSFVWQRPQQIHSRLAATHPVLFIEEPIVSRDVTTPRLETAEPFPNVLVAQPHLPEGADAATNERRVLALLRELAAGPLGETFAEAVHWLYTPLMEPQVRAFRSPVSIVYDCMDELASFAFAPAGLLEREERLLGEADVVFTGGHQLYLSKSRRHPNVHFFGCGVDFDHFQKAARGAAVAPDLAKIPGPRLGYIGVIDERLDYGLLAELARELPHASIAMVGPIVKVDPEALPKAPNIHYLGSKAYADLPSYLAGFDVCLMPFALNEASRYINPTKTLEYLASARPVLSTPVADVVTNFGEVVHIADASGFAARAREVLAGERLEAERGLEVARGSSWESTVARMEALVEEAIASQERRGEAPGAVIVSGSAPGEGEAVL